MSPTYVKCIVCENRVDDDQTITTDDGNICLQCLYDEEPDVCVMSFENCTDENCPLNGGGCPHHIADDTCNARVDFTPDPIGPARFIVDAMGYFDRRA